MGSYQKALQKGITKLQYLLRGSFVLLLFQLTILTLYLKLSSFSSISFNFFAIAAITGTVTLLPACL